MHQLKQFLKRLGLNSSALTRFWFHVNCAFPFRYLLVWLICPRLIAIWARNKLTGRTIICFPECPAEHGYEIAKLSMVLGFKLRQSASNPHIGLTWQDVTVRTFSTPTTARYFLNQRCKDIGKDRVEQVFESVFGYPLRLDPTTHVGPAVRKSTINGKHDGSVIQCPIATREPDTVYQRLVNNQLTDTQSLDLRTPVYRGEIPVIYRKLRPINARFGNANDSVSIARPEDTYTAEERAVINRFCKEFGLDYGGLDIMRDRDDGRLYVVDVNYTPFGPPVELTALDRAHALASLALLFEKSYLGDISPLLHENAALCCTHP